MVDREHPKGADMIDPMVVQLLQRVTDLEEILADDLADLQERRVKAAKKKAAAEKKLAAEKSATQAKAAELLQTATEAATEGKKKKKE